MTQLPIFPLPIYLLPDGITRLRIFEQRYLNMIRDIEKTNGFAISYFNGEDISELPSWASWVDIIDFDMSDDGVLVIDVRCHSLVAIENAQYNNNKLLMATSTLKKHWSTHLNDEARELSLVLSEELKCFFNENEMFDDLYKIKNFDDPIWVCSRWLELVPVSFKHKSHFTEEDSFYQALTFIETILTCNDDS